MNKQKRSSLTLSVLGPFRATLEGRPLPNLATIRAQALLVYLVVESALGEHSHRREALVELLWPGMPPASGRKNLRQTLYYLRKSIPDYVGDNGQDVPLLLADRQEVSFNPEYPLILDVADFVRLLDGPVDEWGEAVELYRGEFLTDLSLADANPFEEWAGARRAYFHQRALEALERLAEDSVQRSALDQARRYAQRQLELDNLRERAHRQLMEILALSGRRNEAMAQFEEYRRLLAQELGVEPLPETAALYERIAAGQYAGGQRLLSRLNDYEMEDQIGAGAHGAVYRARQRSVNRQVAIKIIRKEHADEPDFVRRFEAEAQIVARLEHPHIVPIYDFWRDDTGAYTVLRLLPGGSLADMLAEGPLDPELLVSIVEHIGQALDYSHGHGIVHRDLKPSNILFDEGGNAYLTDFGIAKNLATESKLTPTGAILGTPDYLSPEQIQGKSITPAADQYNLGIVIFQSLSGQVPFPNLDIAALLHKHLVEPLPPLSAIRSDLPVEIDDVLRKATAKEPSDRYADVAGLVDAVRHCLIPEPVSAISQSDGLSHLHHNLPQQVTPLIGREREVEELVEWLVNEPDRRLVTIIGPGGIGKSRLSLEAAASVLDNFVDGVFFTPLAPLDSAGTIVPALADSIGFRFLGAEDPQQQLLEHLSRKRMLLVMDNFEHLLEGAHLPAAILAEAPGVKILATSRQRLGLTAETVFHIGGLAYPSIEEDPYGFDPGRYGAIQLLRHQAALTRPDLQLSAEDMVHAGRISYLVQGMPLAIILAAGWLELLSLEEIADEIARSLDFLESDLRDLPERQRSMQAVFESSWRRLSEAQQDGLMKLAIFRGGFNREAAELVANTNLRALRALIDKSLINTELPGRYAFHELLRQFAAMKLERAGRAGELYRAHATYYLNSLVEWEKELKGHRQLGALNEIETDFDNVRAAWTWALNQNEWNSIDQATEALFLFIEMRDRNTEGIELLESVREQLVDAPMTSRLWRRLSTRAIYLQSEIGEEQPDALSVLENNMAVALDSGDQSELAFTLLALGYFQYHLRTNFQQGLEYFKKCLLHYRELGDKFYMSRALHRIALGSAQVFARQDAYMDYNRQSLDLAQAIGNQVDAALVLVNLGSGLLTYGEFDDAEVYLDQAIALAGKIGSKISVAHGSVLMALRHFLLGETEQALIMASKALSIASQIGFTVTEGYALAVQGLLAGTRGDYSDAIRLGEESRNLKTNRFGQMLADLALAIGHVGLDHTRAWNRGISALKPSIEHGWASQSLWPLPVLAIVLARRDELIRSVELLGLAQTHQLSPTGWQKKWALLDETKARLREKLERETYDRAWQRGEILDLENLLNQLLAEEIEVHR